MEGSRLRREQNYWWIFEQMNRSAPSSKEVPSRVIEQFWERVNILEPDACWPWKLSVGSHRYGQVFWWADGRAVGTTAHRVAWIASNGPLPEDMTVHHVCHNRSCCNPRHLQLRPRVENARDNGWDATRVRPTHCPQGHPYDLCNTHYDKHGWRHCRACWEVARHKKREGRKQRSSF